MNEPIMVSEASLRYMKGTSGWVTFLAILAFIGTAFMGLVSLITLAAASFARADPRVPETVVLVMGCIYLLFTVFLLLIPGILLIRYSRAISGIQNSGQAALEAALARQKTFWKYAGILMIVILVIEVPLWIGVLGFGLFHGTMLHP